MACWIEKGKGIRSTGELSGKALLIGWCLSRGDEGEGVEVCGIWKKNVIGTVIIWNTWLSYYPSRNTLLPWCGQLPFSVFLYALVFTSKIAFIIRCCIVHVCVSLNWMWVSWEQGPLIPVSSASTLWLDLELGTQKYWLKNEYGLMGLILTAW